MPPNDLAPLRPHFARGELFAPRPDLAPSLQGGRASGGRRADAATSPRQLDLFDAFDDALDFGAWMERLPLDPSERM